MKSTSIDKAGAGDASSNANTPLQQILGTDKRNPVFSLYRDPHNGKLHVYYGMQLLEIVIDDYHNFSFRCLLGRLYNARVKAKSLQECFGVDRKTMQRWGEALQKSDVQEVLRGLAGRGEHGKLSPEIRGFVRLRFAQLYGEGCGHYSQKIRQEISEVFGVSLSGEALRPMFKDLKGQWAQQADPAVGDQPDEGNQKRETAWEGREPDRESGWDCCGHSFGGPAVGPEAQAESGQSEDPVADGAAEAKRATDCDWPSNQPEQSAVWSQTAAIFGPPQTSTDETMPKDSPEGAQEIDPAVGDQPDEGNQKRETAWEARREPDTESGWDCCGHSLWASVGSSQAQPEDCQTEGPISDELSEAKRATTCEGASIDPGLSELETENSAVFDSPKASTDETLPKESPVLADPPLQGSFCRHVGLLCFSALLTRIGEHFATAGERLKQWVGTVLLGAVNIEQTKWLDWKDLQKLLGSVIRQPHQQRCEIKALAGDGQTLAALLAFNAQELELDTGGGDFYLDPHTKHYTGKQNVLKGWCPRIRSPDKVLHTDFIHTAEGDPIFMNCTDNYEDLRQRLWPFVERFRKELGFREEAVLTLVIDRAIFSGDFFAKVLDCPHYHIITWEKNYPKGQWDEKELAGEFVIERVRNHAADIRSYHFRYMDRSWSKNPQMRQLVVVATNPKGRSIEVAILTDDFQRPAQEIIALIFNRWLQENDFKYLDSHFGINEITSYASVAFAKLSSHLEDKQVQSGALKALQQRQKELKAQLSRLLLAEHNHPAASAKRTAQIEALTNALKQLESDKAEVQKEVSRLQTLIDQETVRLDTTDKSLMDTIKILARNAFYEHLMPFQKAYNNYRDDHELFRQFTQSDGILFEDSHRVEAHLLPTPNLSPKVRKILRELLDHLNASGLMMPDGSGRSLQLFLGEKAGIELASKIG